MQVRVVSCPLGVPFERFGNLAESAEPMKIEKPREAQVRLMTRMMMMMMIVDDDMMMA